MISTFKKSDRIEKAVTVEATHEPHFPIWPHNIWKTWKRGWIKMPCLRIVAFYKKAHYTSLTIENSIFTIQVSVDYKVLIKTTIVRQCMFYPYCTSFICAPWNFRISLLQMKKVGLGRSDQIQRKRLSCLVCYFEKVILNAQTASESLFVVCNVICMLKLDPLMPNNDVTKHSHYRYASLVGIAMEWQHQSLKVSLYLAWAMV